MKVIESRQIKKIEINNILSHEMFVLVLKTTVRSEHNTFIFKSLRKHFDKYHFGKYFKKVENKDTFKND